MSTAVAEPPRKRQITVWGSKGGYGGTQKGTIDIPPSLRVLTPEEPNPEGHIIFRICTPEGGDERLAWNPYRIQEVAEARQHFRELIAKGYYAYKIDPNTGGRGELVRKFEDIISDGEVMMTEIRPAEAQPPVRQAVEVVMHPRPVGG